MKGKIILWMVLGLILPFGAMAQGMASEIKSLQSVLDQLYDEMIGLSGELIGVARGIAGFAAIFYISARVWRHIANAEPVDFYPLFRPFVLGFCIIFFPMILGMINGLMKPTVNGTAAMMDNSNQAIAVLLKQKEEAVRKSDHWKMYVGEDNKGDRDAWYRYTHDNEDPKDESWYNAIGNDVKFAMEKVSYNFRNSVKQWMSEVLEVLFQAAALCINTLRTFQLIVLGIIGPLVFGIAVFDGFQHTLTAWIARYLNVFLWLPVANIFSSIIGKIQENMLKIDLAQIDQYGDTFFSRADTGYLIFMLIGIVGYFTVPSVANFIVNAGGGGALGHKVSSFATGAAMGAGKNAMETGGALMNVGRYMQDGYNGATAGGASGGIGKAIGKSGAYMADKLSGKDQD